MALPEHEQEAETAANDSAAGFSANDMLIQRHLHYCSEKKIANF